MPFNRPPRIQTPLPSDKIKIPQPRDVPSKPGALNWVMIVLPLGAVAITILLMTSLSGGSGFGKTYLFFLPMMLITYIGSAITYFFGKRKYRRELAAAKERYDQELTATEATLQSLHAEERRLREAVHPDPQSCLLRAQDQDPRLGERRPRDPDFLDLRLGLGTRDSSIELEGPDGGDQPPEFEAQIQFAEELAGTYAHVDQVPIPSHLARAGSMGIAGSRSTVLQTARAVLCQLVTHHWPTEVQVAAICRPEDRGMWTWMHALPHATHLFQWMDHPASEGEGPPKTVMTALEGELQRREQWLVARKEARIEGAATPPLPRLVILFDSLPTEYTHPGLNLLLEEGPALGVHGLFLTLQPQSVPGQCAALVTLREGAFTYRETGPEGVGYTGEPDALTLAHAAALGEALAAIDWPQDDDLSQPPQRVGFLELFGAQSVEHLPAARWWDGESPFGALRAPIGKTSATADLVFDLNDHDGAHGPHGLLGGMTGSGKSEALKTILLALAVTHNPHDLNFALIDFKGGAAFNELARLPHTVGVVTDIESHATYAERVIQALTGEIEQRKRLLESARSAFDFGRSHIDEYHKLKVKRPLPHLVIVFDEFAEFKQGYPEESKRLISIARQGRSLGVHLILATQNIEAAVDPEILQNSTFRICLRVSGVQDSMQMIGTPDAINLTRGRAYFKAKNLYLVQLGFAGVLYQAPERPRRAVGRRAFTRVLPDGRRERVRLPLLPPEDDGPAAGPPTEAQAVVDHLLQTARQMQLRRPSAVWPDPLPERLYLPDLLHDHTVGGWDGTTWHPCRMWSSGDGERGGGPDPLLGLYDNPLEQEQVVYQPERARGGHLLVLGSASSGKSTLLRTLVTSLARTHTPQEAHVYVFDFGGQSTLKVLEGFPHVGAVVTRFEPERVQRLILHLQAEVSKRNELFRKAQVDSLDDYNARVPERARLPSVHVLIDGFADFKRALEIELVRQVSALLGGAAAIGLRMVVAASLQADVPNDLFANIDQRLTFHQADQTEYFRIVGQPSQAKLQEEVSRRPPPGRGLLRATPPLEFQAALPTQAQDHTQQTEQLNTLAEAMRRTWEGPLPQQIRALPLLVTLPPAQRRSGSAKDRFRPELHATIGQDYETLAPTRLSLDEDGPTFLIAGAAPGSGKTTLMRTWLLGLGETYRARALHILLLDFHTRTLAPLRGLPHCQEYVGTQAMLEDALARLGDLIHARRERLEQAYQQDPEGFDSERLVRSWPYSLVAIDDYEHFATQCEQQRPRLADLLTQGTDLGVGFLVAGNAAELPRDFDDPFMQRTRRHGCGALLGAAEGLDQFNNARRPPGSPLAALPPGRGFLVTRGHVRLFQAAVYWQEGEEPNPALSRRVQRVSARAQPKQAGPPA